MQKDILLSCGILEYYENGNIMLTDEIEKEIKQVLTNEEKFVGKDLTNRCLWCKNHQEYKNDFCQILDKQTLCSDICDQFERKMTVKEAEILGYFDGLILGEDDE